MKILYDYRIFSLQKYGGVSRYFLELIKNITHLDEDTEIFLFQGIHINKYDISLFKKDLSGYLGIKRPYLNKTLNVFYQINRQLFSVYRKTKRFKYYETIYHPTYYSKDIKNLKNTYKTVLTVYDMIHEKFPEYFPKANKEISAKKESIKNADRIICISKSTRKDLLDYYDVDPKKTFVIYPGPNLMTSDSLIGKYNNRRPYILFVGKRMGYKNFLLLLNAYYNGGFFKDFDILCFGGEEFSLEELQKISKPVLRNKVNLLKGDDTQLISLYKGASCLVYPSLYEGFGMPILEAMIQGCPVISANSSSLAEVGGDAALYFKPDDSSDLISGLTNVLRDSVQRDKMISKGFEQAKKFSWAENAKSTLKIYRKCLGNAK